MGDICKVGTRTQSVTNPPPPRSIHLMSQTKPPTISLTKDRVPTPAGRFRTVFPQGIPSFLPLEHTLPCSMNCMFFLSYFENSEIITVIDLAGASFLACFPMGIRGGRVAGYSRNIFILPIPVSMNRARWYMSGNSSDSSYRRPTIFLYSHVCPYLLYP